MGTRLTGWGSGMAGVVIFSGSLPATRLAVADFPPLFLTSARAAIAALLAATALLVWRQPAPRRSDAASLAIVALGVVIGFPLLTALALAQMPAARSILFIGLLPLATATFGVLRGNERPRAPFWLFSMLGAAVVAGFALWGGGGQAGPGDLMMIAAILLCGLGYAEGGLLSRRLGGWQVISWSLLMALPGMAVLTWASWPAALPPIAAPGWLGLAYVSVFSMLVGFVFWYRGLALGGIAGVGQLQLLQPFLGLGLAALVLGEPIAPLLLVSALAVVLCVAAARRFT